MPKTPGAPGSSGKVYLTPQIEKQAKRREGLCPSLLMDNHVQASHSKHGNGHTALTKSYQTNSKFLTSTIRDVENDAEELKFIVDSVGKYLSEIVDEKKKKTDLVAMKFIPKGCYWVLEMNSDVGAPDYLLTVNVLAKGEGNGTTTFVVDTNLVGRSSKSVTSTSLPGFREAKGVLEHTALVVRKGVVRCEFPVFPEGLKGKTFREIYQLNARVSQVKQLLLEIFKLLNGRFISMSSFSHCSSIEFFLSTLRSSSRVRLQQSVVERIELVARRWLSNASSERTFPRLMMPPFMTK